MRTETLEIPFEDRIPIPSIPRGFFAQWYEANGRVFPWRGKTSPFGILIAEVLLRQTKAEMVARVWPVFRQAYPTPRKLASARDERLRHWLEPLGLQRQRAQAIKALAAHIETRHGGRVPKTRRALLAVPHLGIYAASAVRVFAFGFADAVIDANVVRVLARITGQNLGPDPRRDPRIAFLAWKLLERRKAREHNFGLLDFAAAICKPQKPLCHSCPLLARCTWGQRQVALGLISAQELHLDSIVSSCQAPKHAPEFRETTR